VDEEAGIVGEAAEALSQTSCACLCHRKGNLPALNAMERFTPPDENQRRGAIGPTTGLPKMLQRAFDQNILILAD
jgi:hypothetical protein